MGADPDRSSRGGPPVSAGSSSPPPGRAHRARSDTRRRRRHDLLLDAADPRRGGRSACHRRTDDRPASTPGPSSRRGMRGRRPRLDRRKDNDTAGDRPAIVNLSCGRPTTSRRSGRGKRGTISWLLVMTTVSGACIGVLALFVEDFLRRPAAGVADLLGALASIPGTTRPLPRHVGPAPHPRRRVVGRSFVGVPIVAAIGAAIFIDEPFGP